MEKVARKRVKPFLNMEKGFFSHVKHFRQVAEAFFTDFAPFANLRRYFSCIFDLSLTCDTIFQA